MIWPFLKRFLYNQHQDCPCLLYTSIDDVEEIETTDEHFCWTLCGATGVIGFAVGWIFKDVEGMNMAAFGIAGGVIGYALGYIILEIKRKLK